MVFMSFPGGFLWFFMSFPGFLMVFMSFPGFCCWFFMSFLEVPMVFSWGFLCQTRAPRKWVVGSKASWYAFGGR